MRRIRSRLCWLLGHSYRDYTDYMNHLCVYCRHA